MDIGLNNRNMLGDINSEFIDVVFFIEANSNERSILWQEWAKESITNIEPLSDKFIEGLPLKAQITLKELNNKIKIFNHKRVIWEQVYAGFRVTIGQVNKSPVFVSFSFAFINGKKVCFYDCTSKIVDYSMVEKWLITHFQLTHDDYTRWNHVDANNFHNCVNSLDKLDKEPRDTFYKHFRN